VKAVRLAVVLGGVAGLGTAFLAWPSRYELAGVSMAPGLSPGDVVVTDWWPRAGRWRKPTRWERWIVTLPDGSTGIKRVVGLAGETISIEGGDLTADGKIVVKGPRVLAEIGSPLPAAGGRPTGAVTSWSHPAATIVDEAPFAPDEGSRRLLPVVDAGCAAVIRVPSTGPARLRARCGPLGVLWRLPPRGRYGVVIGRVDHRAVASAWRIESTAADPVVGRSCLPPGAPEAWHVSRPWPSEDDADGRAAELSLHVEGVTDSASTDAVIERVDLWRDALYRPAADGTTRWELGPGRLFVLGDFPSGSRDSRHFGGLPEHAFRQPIRGWRER